MNCVQFLAQLAGVLENAQENLSSLVFLLFLYKKLFITNVLDVFFSPTFYRL